MSHANPLLDSAALPRFDAIEAAHVAPAIDAVLADYRTQIDALTATTGARN